MFDWNPAHRDTVLTLAVVTVAYVLFYYGARSRDQGPQNATAVFRQRLLGFLVLGVLPALIAVWWPDHDATALGLGIGHPLRALAWVSATAAVVLPFVFASSRRPASWQDYPEIRAPRWDRRLFLANAGTWALYLVAYEFLFRGFVLMSLQHQLGTWPAIAITTALYVFVHLPKNAGETIGTIPMGVVFAMAALDTGSIWAPFAIHLIIAVSSDTFVTIARARAGHVSLGR